MKSQAQLRTEHLLQGLQQYTRSSASYHRFREGFFLSDGAKFLAETGGIFRLMNVIVSVRDIPAIKKHRVQSWILTVDLVTANAQAICTDGQKQELYRKEFRFTDFPLEEARVIVCDNVIMLASEYQ